MTDFLKTLSALAGTEHSSASSKIKDNILLIDFIGVQNIRKLSRISRCSCSTVCDSNFLEADSINLSDKLRSSNAKRKVFIIDNDVDVTKLENFSKYCTDIIFVVIAQLY